jgi:hypothetical protein
MPSFRIARQTGDLAALLAAQEAALTKDQIKNSY